jgi:hypothetical protein
MRYIKKPVVIEAIQWNGSNNEEIQEFVGEHCEFLHNEFLFIFTLEGNMRASISDFIIKGINDEFYPCKPDIFKLTYSKADEQNK